MMLKKHSLCALTLLCTTPVFANIPIESRGLSQATNNSVNPTSVAVDTGASATATNINWQIMQKNQQLESDLRSLRGKLEEQDNEIAQLKHELENRVTTVVTRNLVIRLHRVGSNGVNVVTLADVRRHAGYVGLSHGWRARTSALLCVFGNRQAGEQT